MIPLFISSHTSDKVYQYLLIVHDDIMAQVVPPCSAFCSEFLAACDGYIPGGLLDSVRCDKLPTEADGPGACISKPGDTSDTRLTSCMT